MPQADGSQRAIQIMIFAESQRGTGEGHRPWDRPGTTMTNATVDTTVAGVDGQVIMVKYKDGEKKIVVGPDAVIRRYVVGSKDELKPGANIASCARRRSRTARSRPTASMSVATASCRSAYRRALSPVAAAPRRVHAREPRAGTSRSLASRPAAPRARRCAADCGGRARGCRCPRRAGA